MIQCHYTRIELDTQPRIIKNLIDDTGRRLYDRDLGHVVMGSVLVGRRVLGVYVLRLAVIAH